MSADTKIAELLTELHQLIKQTQVSRWRRRSAGGGGLGSVCLCRQEERSRSEHNLLNIQKTHERMQTENKSQWIEVPDAAAGRQSSRLTLSFRLPQPPPTTGPS